MGSHGDTQDKQTEAALPRKPSFARYHREIVPQSDTGRLAEHAKAREITLVKELGKMAP